MPGEGEYDYGLIYDEVKELDTCTDVNNVIITEPTASPTYDQNTTGQPQTAPLMTQTPPAKPQLIKTSPQ